MELKDLQKFDVKRMYEAYDKWPEIARESYEKSEVNSSYEKVGHIAICGMGGSGTLGDFIESILSKEKIHVSIIKGYTLPRNVGRDTLLIVISISGDTEETLSALKHGQEIGCRTIAFSSGGNMKKYCDNRKIDFYQLEMINSPRVSFVNFLFPILKILENILKINEQDVKKTLESLEGTRENICSENLSISNKALALAEWIEPTPVIYYPYGLKAAAVRFKNSLQENSKMHVINEDLIEACHNGIVAWEQTSTSKPIFIRGKDDHPQTKIRWDILKKYFKEKNISYKEIISEEDSIFSKLINLIYVLDYTSVYKAILLKIDPTPVKSIDFIKGYYSFKQI